eukprot:comp24100_c1_seq1/m.43517 comp24100_c1_seq1/g.43517  ORF comp24100_c1_seq1/g.43517 comp24100_c1_seq1/m.43517 type:complete len:308 (+) comp24100_c1_seq1:5498-6421(+)
MLQNGAGLILLDTLGHHVHDVVHHRRTQLQVKVRLHTLLGDRLGNALAVSPLKLTGQKVPQPALQEGDDAAQEEDPYTPTRRPEPTPWTLAHCARVEAVVDQMLQVLAHADLPHQLVLVAVHACKLTHVCEDVLHAISQLECIDVAQTILHVSIHDQLGQAQNLTAQMEGIAEATLLTLLGGECLDGLEVEVVVQVQVVEVLAVDQQVEHVVALTAHLQTGLDPVELSGLEELCGLKGAEHVALLKGLGGAVVQLVQHEALEQLLVRHTHLDRLVGRHVLLVPLLNQGHVHCAACAATAPVEWVGCP